MKAIVKDNKHTYFRVGSEVEVLEDIRWLGLFSHCERHNYVWVVDAEGTEQVIISSNLRVIQ